jgi:hypothetical protein
VSSFKESPWEELMRRDKAKAKAKSLIVEHQHKKTDELLTHTAQVVEERRMPNALPAIRAWWWRLFRKASKTPRHRGLMATCMGEIYYVEGVMSRWLVIPDVLDEDLDTEYKALLSRYKNIDYSQFMIGGKSDHVQAGTMG